MVRVAVIYPAPFVIALLLRDMFAVPSNETPAIVLAVSKAVAVAAFPVISLEVSASVPVVSGKVKVLSVYKLSKLKNPSIAV